MHLAEFELKPDIDYTLNIIENNNVFEGVIKCKCGTRIKLRKKADRCEMTIFYKHLRSASCFMMKEKKKQHDQQEQLPSNTHDNDDNNNSDDDNDQLATSSSATPRQPLSHRTSNAPTSQSQRANIESSTAASGIKRNLSSLRATNSQPLSAKKNKK